MTSIGTTVARIGVIKSVGNVVNYFAIFIRWFIKVCTFYECYFVKFEPEFSRKINKNIDAVRPTTIRSLMAVNQPVINTIKSSELVAVYPQRIVVTSTNCGNLMTHN